mgnify:CR=1 FL=1
MDGQGDCLASVSRVSLTDCYLPVCSGMEEITAHQAHAADEDANVQTGQ